MAGDSSLTLPGKFEAGKKYLLDGATLKAWQDALKADRVIAGSGLKESGTPAQGRIFSVVTGATGETRPFTLTAGVPQSILTISSIAGEPPPGFVNGCLLLTLAGAGYVMAKVTISQTTGLVTARDIVVTTIIPANTDSTFYTAIASFWTTEGTLMSANMAYGPVNVTICRNWFAAASPYFGVSITAA